MEQENTELEREIIGSIKKERFLAIYQKYKKIILTLFAIFILIPFAITISHIVSNKQNIAYSTKLYQAYSLNSQSNNIKIEQFKDIYYEGMKGSKILAGLNYANILVTEKRFDDAIEIYLEINGDSSYDDFIRKLSGFLALKIMVDDKSQKYQKQISGLLIILKAQNNDHFQYLIAEQEAIFDWNNKRYEIAYNKFLQLSNPLKQDIAQDIKNRAKIMANYAIKAKLFK